MNRFRPYFSMLRKHWLRFAAGVLAGLVYAFASGLGMPLMTQKVFPVIFGQSQSLLLVRDTMTAAKGEKEARELMEQAFPGKIETLEKTEATRQWVVGLVGEKHASKALLLAACLAIPFVFLVRGVAGFLNVYWTTQCGLGLLKDLQQLVFEKLQRLPLGFFSGKRTGDLISRVMGDTGNLQIVLTTVANDIIKQPFTLFSAFGFLIWSSIQNRETFFVLLCLLSIPFCVLPIRLVGKRMTMRAATMQASLGENTAVLGETLGAAREIRAFNLEDLMAGRFLDGIARLMKMTLKMIKYRNITPPVIEVISALVISIALFYGARKHFTLEAFLPLVGALYMCYDPIKSLGQMHNRLREAVGSIDRLEEILHADEGTPDPVNPKVLGHCSGVIDFKDMTFAYGDHVVLKDINVHIPAGQIVALVGPSGAGKTTFASLVPRFYDPIQGSICLDGMDLREMRKKDLRSHITLVPQEAVLFSGTIGENILLGKGDATEADVREAARQASAHHFIEEQPAGYHTQVGERGAQLSGGQKQRISMARAFLKNAPVLILDEATAALDSDSESRIQKELADLARGRTTLIIAHRFSTIRIAHRILVFDQGRIVGDGTFAELEQSNPLFRLLLEQQRMESHVDPAVGVVG